MACGGCAQRREQIGIAAKAALQGDLKTASISMADVARTMTEDATALARSAGQRLAAAHARLKR